MKIINISLGDEFPANDGVNIIIVYQILADIIPQISGFCQREKLKCILC